MRGNIKTDLASKGVLFNEKYWEQLLTEIGDTKDSKISFLEFRAHMLDMNKKGNTLKKQFSSLSSQNSTKSDDQ